MSLSQLCTELKALNLGGHVSLWIVHRYLDDERRAVYKILRVDIADELQKKLRDLTSNTIKGIGSLARYNYETPPEDRRVFVLDASDGGFDPLRAMIERGTMAPLVESDKDLINSFAYIAKITVGRGQALYAFRKVSDAWTTKKVGGLKSMNTYFDGGMLIDLDDKPVFRIDLKLDFLEWNGSLFILDREAFEMGLNFREGLERSRDQLVKEFEELQLFTNASVFVNTIGDRLPLLRKVASIRQNAYYKDETYVKSLIQQAGQHGWPVDVVDNRIVVTEERVPILLKLFNNDRLRSPINLQWFDVWGKEPVPAAVAAVAQPPGPRLQLAPVRRASPQKSKRTPSRGRKRQTAS